MLGATLSAVEASDGVSATTRGEALGVYVSLSWQLASVRSSNAKDKKRHEYFFIIFIELEKKQKKCIENVTLGFSKA